METAKVIWSDKAISNLRKIHSYISEDSLERANKVVEKILAKTSQLELFPKSGRKIPALNEFVRYRELIVKPYRVQYKVENNVVSILQVIHSKQFFERLF